jgi:penicillin-binding protein-related factor A (putative recombinase)
VELPPLTRQNKQKEALFGVRFREWIEKNPQHTSSFETKDTRGKDKFNLSELKDKQRVFANQVESDKGVLVRVQGMNGEADYIYLRKELAYVVIKYPDCFCLIRVNKLPKQKSLSSKQAREISELTISSSL